ncbi:MFS transporter [Fluviispira vulneris]|uniref:MFS transporter n=1 Tax=Fluviispira vulneris TaxID=2763012 RepID=UPI00164492BE|nr:MFS transporter [Fluviispira vulneris]
MNFNFFYLFSGYSISLGANWIYRIALPLYILKQTNSAISMSITFAITFLPYLIFTPFGGAIADAFDKRKILIIGDLLTFIFSLAITSYIFFDINNLYLFFILVFLISSIPPIYHPALQSFIPNIVKTEKLASANALISSSDNIVNAMGPILCGLLITIIDLEKLIMISCIIYLAAFILVLCIKTNKINTINNNFSIKQTFLNISEGFKYTIQSRVIFGCSILFLFINFSVNLIMSNLIYILKSNFNATSLEIGISFSIMGVMGALGAYIAKIIIGKIYYGKTILISAFLMSVIFISISLINTKLLIVFSLLWGSIMLFNSIIVVNFFTMRQRIIPILYLGRVIATTRLISFTSIPFASILGGYLIQKNFSFQNLAIISAVFLITSSLLGFKSPIYNKENILPSE